MQLLVKYDVSDMSAWQDHYDEHSEERGNAGIRQLQLWREGQTTVWGLYDVSEKRRADDHLDSYGKLEGGVAERHYVERL